MKEDVRGEGLYYDGKEGQAGNVTLPSRPDTVPVVGVADMRSYIIWEVYVRLWHYYRNHRQAFLVSVFSRSLLTITRQIPDMTGFGFKCYLSKIETTSSCLMCNQNLLPGFLFVECV